MPPGAEVSTRRRILAATFVVLARSGRKKLMLSDVAAEAKVSRQTLYRYFPSKEALLDAFGLYEQDNFDAGISSAMAGLSGPKGWMRLCNSSSTSSAPTRWASWPTPSPSTCCTQMKRVMPILQARIARLIHGENAELAAATVVRIAVCHYLVGGDDRDQFLAELRYAAGITSTADVPVGDGELAPSHEQIRSAISVGLFEMQEMPGAVDHLERRSRCRQVIGCAGDDLGTQPAVIGAVQVQGRYRRRRQRRRGLGLRIGIGELRD